MTRVDGQEIKLYMGKKKRGKNCVAKEGKGGVEMNNPTFIKIFLIELYFFYFNLFKN